MLKKGFVAAALILAMVLSGCAEPKDEGKGLLTLNEIARCESLYLGGTNSLLDDLRLAEGDIGDRYQGSWELKDTRSIAGKDFEQTLLLSETPPGGLIGVAFHRRLESGSERGELLRELYDQAVSLYGPPDPQPPRDKYSRVLVQLENELPGGCFETWDVGEKTHVELRLFIPSELDPLADGVPGIAIRYRTPITE